MIKKEEGINISQLSVCSCSQKTCGTKRRAPKMAPQLNQQLTDNSSLFSHSFVCNSFTLLTCRFQKTTCKITVKTNMMSSLENVLSSMNSKRQVEVECLCSWMHVEIFWIYILCVYKHNKRWRKKTSDFSFFVCLMTQDFSSATYLRFYLKLRRF